VKNDLMATLAKVFTNAGRSTILQIDIAASKGSLGEPGDLQSFLNTHSEIDDVGNELRVRLRLVKAAHDSERDPFLSVGHETRNDRMQRPLVTGELIGGVGVDAEEPSAIVENETGSIRHEARPELRIVALNEGHHVPVAIGDAQIRRVAARWEFGLPGQNVAIRLSGFAYGPAHSFVKHIPPSLATERLHRASRVLTLPCISQVKQLLR
jgi:hypothetical protein